LLSGIPTTLPVVDSQIILTISKSVTNIHTEHITVLIVFSFFFDTNIAETITIARRTAAKAKWSGVNNVPGSSFAGGK
jgi:hypothetical protein